MSPGAKTKRKIPGLGIPGLTSVDLPQMPKLERGDGFRQRDLLKHPVVVSTGKVKHMLGFRARYSSLETLTSFVNAALV